MKNYRNFVAFNGKNILVVFTVVVFFIAANSAINAAKIGYQSLVGLPHCKVSKCSCQRLGGDSLSYIYTLIFHSTMARAMKDYSSMNNSNANVTHDCESVNLMAQPEQFKEFVLTPQAIQTLKQWTYEERSIDEPLIEIDIRTIGQVEDFILDRWDIDLRDTSDREIKSMLLGLHFVKRNLKELVESMQKEGIYE